ncbi:hypothetical protein ACE1BM_02545, partial [Aeromonas jandaei]
PQTQQLGERVMGIGLWLWQGAEDRMVHGVSPLLIETLSGINQQDTPPPLSLRTPEMTITLVRINSLSVNCTPDNNLQMRTNITYYA